jgi:hypothetical protein
MAAAALPAAASSPALDVLWSLAEVKSAPASPAKNRYAANYGEAVVAFGATQFRVEWRCGDTLTLTDMATDEVIFDGSADERSVYRGESVYFVTISQNVNRLTAWLTAQGVLDCEQPDEPEWSVCPPYNVRKPDRDDDNFEDEHDDDDDDDDDDDNDREDVARPHPNDPTSRFTYDHLPRNHFTRFLETLCQRCFGQRLDVGDVVTGTDMARLYAIVFNQRPPHWNN